MEKMQVTPTMVITDSLMNGVEAGLITAEIAEACLVHLDNLESAVRLTAKVL